MVVLIVTKSKVSIGAVDCTNIYLHRSSFFKHHYSHISSLNLFQQILFVRCKYEHVVEFLLQTTLSLILLQKIQIEFFETKTLLYGFLKETKNTSLSYPSPI